VDDWQETHALKRILASVAGLQDDEHGSETPQRFLSMLSEMTQCSVDVSDVGHIKDCIKWKMFPSHTDEMIVVDSIPFVSLCNHHLVPFSGIAHVAYVPQKSEAGLSKFPRVVQHFAQRLQVQERMTAEIADYLERALEPRGVAVVLRAEHMCMAFRGVKVRGVTTTTSAMRGVFAMHERTAKAEFMAIINGNGRNH